MASYSGEQTIRHQALRKRNGAALAMVILLLLVLSISVVTILAVSFSENKTEIHLNNQTQAHYLAWSGANGVGNWIIKNSVDAFSLVNKKSINTNSFPNGEIEVSVTLDSLTNNLIVNAKGTVNGVSQIASLRLEQLSSNLLLDRAIYSNAPLDIKGMLISGDVQSGGNIVYSDNGSNEFVGKYFANEPRYYELEPFPSEPLYNVGGANGVLDLKNTTKTITGSGNSFSSITVENNASLTLEPNGVMKIVADDVVIDNDLNINISSETERVELYINRTLKVTTSGFINNVSGDPNNLVIYLKAGSTFYMQANKVLNGYVIGPNATMEIQSAQSTTNGALITNVIRKNEEGQGPNGAVNYIPPKAFLDIDKTLIAFRVLRWEN